MNPKIPRILRVELERKCALYMVDAASVLELRHRVLRPGEPCEAAQFAGDDEPTTKHFLLAHQEHTGADPATSDFVCCASFLLRPYENRSAYQLRGMATEPEYCGHGFGAIMLAMTESYICYQTSIRLFWCKARKIAVPFYEKCGWLATGTEFEIEKIGTHQTMLKQL